MLTITAFDHVVLNVADVERAADWYERVLGMAREPIGPAPGGARGIAMLFGRNKINLRPISATQEEWFTGVEPQPGSDDLCFLTEAIADDVVAHFGRCGVAVELGPITRRGARGNMQSVYVRDPDGNLIEVANYPAG
jgi:catechol 2,3-dioxygenase-like lactoylglutathione lyase family enzyme